MAEDYTIPDEEELFTVPGTEVPVDVVEDMDKPLDDMTVADVIVFPSEDRDQNPESEDSPIDLLVQFGGGLGTRGPREMVDLGVRENPDVSTSPDILASMSKDNFQTALNTSSSVQTRLLWESLMDTLPEVEVQGTKLVRLNAKSLSQMAGNIIITKPDSSSGNTLGTLEDPRLGVIERDRRCATCSGDMHTCPGHIGIIPLPEPRLDPSPMILRNILRVLSSVCGDCGMLKMPEKMLEQLGILRKKGQARLDEIEKKSKDMPCSKRVINKPQSVDISRCKKDLDFMTKESVDRGEIVYKYSKSDGKTYVMSAKDVYKTLNSISDHDAKLLGFTQGVHPRDMLFTALPVIPECARAPNAKDGEMTPSDITKFYRKILTLVNEINEMKKAKKDSTSLYEEKLRQLDGEIARMIGVQRTRKGTRRQTVKSVKTLIQGKGSITRRYLQGKRVDYSARAVLSTDPTLRSNEVGIPRHIARSLTRKVEVTPENIDYIQKLFDQNEVINVYKRFANQPKPKKIVVTEEAKKLIGINVGDMVDRAMQDGDYVIFNRQPTLSRHSMMSAKAKITDRLVIDLHLAQTKSLNADFDGDEATLHAPQGEGAEWEVKNLMSVEKCLISNQTNAPNMGATFDTIVGSYMMTGEDVFVIPEILDLALDAIEPPIDINDLMIRAKMHYVPIDSGKFLFSTILPRDFYYQEKGVNIQNGILISGRIKKAHIGYSHNTIGQAIFKTYGQETTTDYITNLFRVNYIYTTQTGISISIGDCMLDEKSIAAISNEELQRAKLLINSIEPSNDPIEAERQEQAIIAEVNRTKNIGTKLAADIFEEDNNLFTMVSSGAKGDLSNATQITTQLGQQFSGSKRPTPTLQGNRCLPVFPVGDRDPEARGLCTHSLGEGLTVSELFFHSFSTRKGIIDRRISTSVTGAMNRKISKSVGEDNMIGLNGAAVGSRDIVIQPVYGYDGLNSIYLESTETLMGFIPVFLDIKRESGRLNTVYGYNLKDGVWS